MFTMWLKRGRDTKTDKTTVIPHYKAPDNLSPSSAGTIYDEKLHSRDITASIIDFAVRGYIRINEIKKDKLIGKKYDYELELIKPYEPEKEFERLIFESLFPINKIGEKTSISKLSKNFTKSIKKIRKSILTQLVKDGYFPHNPEKVRNGYSGFAGILLAIGFYIQITAILSISLVASGVIILIFAQFMFICVLSDTGADTVHIDVLIAAGCVR